MQEEGWFDPNMTVSIPPRHLAQFKPYIELYNDYLNRKFPAEIKKNKELFEIADISKPWTQFAET